MKEGAKEADRQAEMQTRRESWEEGRKKKKVDD